MADVLDPATRSRTMAAVKGKDTSPELRLRRGLHALGLRYSLHARRLPGRPDLVFPRFRAAVFVHGCFWHRHPGCSRATTPATRQDYWLPKFERNVERDREALEALRAAGWRTAVIWECSLGARTAPATAEAAARWLREGGEMLELPPPIA